MGPEEARLRLETIEEKHAAELASLEERNRKLKGKLVESTFENTRLLRDVADLSSRQFTLEKVTCVQIKGKAGEEYLSLNLYIVKGGRVKASIVIVGKDQHHRRGQSDS